MLSRGGTQRVAMGDVWYLKQIDWLQELDEREWGQLRARATRHAFGAGETVFAPARDPRSVYLLESGSVRIYRVSREGDEATLGYIAPGEVFGELAGFGDFPRESFAAAVGASMVWKIPVDLFRSLVTARPRMTMAVTRQVGERLKSVEMRVESLVFRDVRSRLALLLLELEKDFGKREGERRLLDLPLTQSELASLVGASRQSVNAALGELQRDGLIAREGRRMVLLAPDRLRALGEATAHA
jgi:CRP-like cAMP-binding protein